jgi:hypothetical protein
VTIYGLLNRIRLTHRRKSFRPQSTQSKILLNLTTAPI